MVKIAQEKKKKNEYSIKGLLAGAVSGEGAVHLYNKFINKPAVDSVLKSFEKEVTDKITPDMKKVISAAKKRYPEIKEIQVKITPEDIRNLDKTYQNVYLSEDSFHPVNKTEIMPKGIYVSTKNPSVLAHELGHASDFNKHPMSGKIYSGINQLGNLGALSLLGSDEYRDYAPLVAGVGEGFGSFIPEITANIKGYKIYKDFLKRKGLPEKNSRKYLWEASKALGTHGLAFAGTVGSTYLAAKLVNYLRDKKII